jgi:hypothetical protein
MIDERSDGGDAAAKSGLALRPNAASIVEPPWAPAHSSSETSAWHRTPMLPESRTGRSERHSGLHAHPAGLALIELVPRPITARTTPLPCQTTCRTSGDVSARRMNR